MKKVNYILFGMLLLIGLSSCSKKLTPLTQGMVEEFDWTETDLKRVQFYLSNDIVLTRDLGREESRITNGKVRVVNGREVEEVRFKKNTPGVIIFSPKGNKYAVSFESSDDKYLIFGPSKKAKGRYVLLAKDWTKNRGKVTYDGKVYNTSSNSAYANLLVDIKLARSTKYKSKEAEGRRI